MKDQHPYLNELLDRKLLTYETLVFLQSSKKAKKVDEKGKQKIEYSVPKLKTNFPNIDHIAFIENAFGISVLQLMQISDVKLQALKNMVTAFFNQASLLKLTIGKALELSQWIGTLRRDGLISQKDRNDLLENVKVADTLLQNDVSPAFYRDDHKQIQILLQYGFAMKNLMELTQNPKTLSRNLHHLTQFFIKKNNPLNSRSTLTSRETTPLFKKLIELGISQSELASLAVQKVGSLKLISNLLNVFLSFLNLSTHKVINYIFKIPSADAIPIKSFLMFLSENAYEKPEILKAIKDAYTSDSHLLNLLSIEWLNAEVKQAAILTYITLIALGIPTEEIDIEIIKVFLGTKKTNFSKRINDQHIKHLNAIRKNIKRLINDEWLDSKTFIQMILSFPNNLHLRLSDIENTIQRLSLGMTWDMICQSETLPPPAIAQIVPSFFDNASEGAQLFTKLLEIGFTKDEITQSIKNIPYNPSPPAFLKKKHHDFIILLIRAGMSMSDVWKLPIDEEYPLLLAINPPYRLSDAQLTFALMKAGVFSHYYGEVIFYTRLKNLFSLQKPHSFFSLIEHSPDLLEEIIAFILDKNLDPLLCFEIWFDLNFECQFSGPGALTHHIRSSKILKDAILPFNKSKNIFDQTLANSDLASIKDISELPLLLPFGITFTQLRKLAKRLNEDFNSMLLLNGNTILHFVSSGFSFRALLECAKNSAASAYDALFHYGHPTYFLDLFDPSKKETDNLKSFRSEDVSSLQRCFRNSLEWLQHLASSNPDPTIRANLSSGQLEVISVALHIDVQYFEDYFIITEQKMPQEKFKDLIKRIIERRKEPKVKVNQKNMAPIFLKQRLPVGIAHVVTTFLSAEDLLATYRVQLEPRAQKHHTSSSDHAMTPATGGASK